MNHRRMYFLSTPILAIVLLSAGACHESRDRGYYDRGYDRGPVVVERPGPVVVERPGPVVVERPGSDWELLGRASVDSRSRPDHDVIPIGHSAGRYKRLDFRVDGGDIELYNMKIVYDNKQVENVSFRHMFDSRGRTHSIDLSGDARHLNRVEFSYRAVSGRPVVSLYGR